MMMRHYLARAIRARWLKTVLAISALAVLTTAASDPLTDLKTGVAAFEGRRYPAAITTLQPLVKRLPKLADYAAWYLGLAESESKNYAASNRRHLRSPRAPFCSPRALTAKTARPPKPSTFSAKTTRPCRSRKATGPWRPHLQTPPTR